MGTGGAVAATGAGGSQGWTSGEAPAAAWTRFSTWCGPGGPGGSYRRASRPGQRCTGTSPGGMTTAPSRTSGTAMVPDARCCGPASTIRACGRSGPTRASPAAWSTGPPVLSREPEIVRKDPGQRGFQVQPKQWAVERTLSWIIAHRRLARDYETSAAHSETVIRWAMIGIMVRRLTRGRPATRPGPLPLSRAVG